MSNDKGKPSSLYFKWSKLNIFNTNPMFPYEWEREREMITKLPGFITIKKLLGSNENRSKLNLVWQKHILS